MNREPESESSDETSLLLEELDLVLGQSSAMRDILRRYQIVRDLECITGPSQKSGSMLREIKIMEQRLRDERHGTSPGVFFEPV